MQQDLQPRASPASRAGSADGTGWLNQVSDRDSLKTVIGENDILDTNDLIYTLGIEDGYFILIAKVDDCDGVTVFLNESKVRLETIEEY